MEERRFRVVQPWGRDLGIQSTLISEHSSVGAAFAAIDSMAAQMLRTGVQPDAIELVVVDERNQIVRRPES